VVAREPVVNDGLSSLLAVLMLRPYACGKFSDQEHYRQQ